MTDQKLPPAEQTSYHLSCPFFLLFKYSPPSSLRDLIIFVISSLIWSIGLSHTSSVGCSCTKHIWESFSKTLSILSHAGSLLKVFSSNFNIARELRSVKWNRALSSLWSGSSRSLSFNAFITEDTRCYTNTVFTEFSINSDVSALQHSLCLAFSERPCKVRLPSLTPRCVAGSALSRPHRVPIVADLIVPPIRGLMTPAIGADLSGEV